MKIDNLLMSIHNKDFDLEKRLEVRKYIPMETKKTIAQSIIYDCTSEESGVIRVDSVERYMSYVRHMITTHTNLEYTDEDYDKLCVTKYGEGTLLNAIMDCFADDAKECTRVLNLMTDDLVYDNSINVVIGKLLYSIGDSLGTFITGMKDKVGELGIKDVISGGKMDVKQLKDILNLIGK